MAMQAKSLDLPLKLKAVLWDMDGTLSDSESVHYLAYKTVFERDFPDMAFNPLTKEYYTANFQGKSKTDSMLRVFPDASDGERFKVAKDLEG
jgi:beta-phosphoglucomutase-like phosphatase (HAD superfamily)